MTIKCNVGSCVESELQKEISGKTNEHIISILGCKQHKPTRFVGKPSGWGGGGQI